LLLEQDLVCARVPEPEGPSGSGLRIIRVAVLGLLVLGALLLGSQFFQHRFLPAHRPLVAQLHEGRLTVSTRGSADSDIAFSVTRGQYRFRDSKGRFGSAPAPIKGGGTHELTVPAAAVRSITVHLGGGRNQFVFTAADAPMVGVTVDTPKARPGDTLRIDTPLTVNGDATFRNFWIANVNRPVQVSGRLTGAVASPFTFAANFTSAGTITTTAVEASPAAPGDDITVNPNVTVESTGGDVIFRAGDNVNLGSGSTVRSDLGNVDLYAGFNDNDGGGQVSVGGEVQAPKQAVTIRNEASGAGGVVEPLGGRVSASSLILARFAGAPAPADVTGFANFVSTIASSWNGALSFVDEWPLTVGTVASAPESITAVGMQNSGALFLGVFQGGVHFAAGASGAGISVTGDDSLGANDNIVVDSNVSLVSTSGGDITLQAPDGITTGSGSILQADTGHVSLEPSYGDSDGFGGASLSGGIIAGAPAAVVGGGGDDPIALLFGAGAQFTPNQLSVDGGAGTNSLDVSDQGDSTGHTYALTGSSVTRDGAQLTSITNIGNVTADGGDGADSFTATMDPDVAFTVNGNLPTSPPGDTLHFAGTFPACTATSGSGTCTAAGKQPLTFTGIEAVDQHVDLSVVKTDDGGGVYSAGTNDTTGGTAPAGGTVTYTIVATNSGPSDVSGASVTDAFPGGLSGVSYTATTGSPPASGFTASGSGNISDTNLTMPAGSSITYTATGTVSPSATAGSAISNIATVAQPGTVTDDDPDNNTSTDTLTVTASADLSITKTGPSTAIPGSNITYGISVANDGPSPAADATMTDPLPPGLTLVSVTPPTGWACPSPPSVAPGSNGTVTCSTTSSVSASSPPAVFSIVAHVSRTATGALSNTASVSSTTHDPRPANNTSSPAVVTTVGCDHRQGSETGSVTLASGSTCIDGATITGNLKIPAGASVVLMNSSVGGRLTATNPGSVTICNSTVQGTVKISGASGFVLLGDPGDDSCTGNNFHSSVSLRSNHGGVELAHNTIAGNTSVTRTSGTGPFPDDTSAEIEANVIGGNLSCTRNTPAAKNDGPPNSVHGRRLGECAGPSF